MVTNPNQLPMIWQLVSNLLAKGITVEMSATHMGDATVGRIEAGKITEVRDDGYILDGAFLALFPEDDEWKKLKKIDAHTFCVVNR